MVGKLAPRRGFDTLLDTAAMVREAPQVIVVGHGEEQPALERQAQRLGLGRRVHWCGYQESALPALYAAMDVVLFMAAGSDHGHRTISEAQACGRLTIALAKPGVRDLIEHGVTGLIAPQTGCLMAEMLDQALGATERPAGTLQAALTAAESRRFLPIGQSISRFLARL
jgi:glycosyltransferase involved in cell wall biosynthesis